MCEEEKDKVTKNQSFLCAVFGGLSLPNTHIFPDNKRYEEVDVFQQVHVVFFFLSIFWFS